MKKITLSLLFLFICATSLYAQITQEQADKIVQERMINETRPFTLYAEDIVQTDYTVLTSANEKLTLNYTCRVYYAKFTEETTGKYLIVKESNGNVLEVNAKNDEGPEDLEEWREVVSYPIEVPIEECSFEDNECRWTSNYPIPSSGKCYIINSYEVLQQFIICSEGNYPEFDFSEYTLLYACGISPHMYPWIISYELIKNNMNIYTLNLVLFSGQLTVISAWIFEFRVPKISDETIITLNITYY